MMRSTRLWQFQSRANQQINKSKAKMTSADGEVCREILEFRVPTSTLGQKIAYSRLIEFLPYRFSTTKCRGMELLMHISSHTSQRRQNMSDTVQLRTTYSYKWFPLPPPRPFPADFELVLITVCRNCPSVPITTSALYSWKVTAQVALLPKRMRITAALARHHLKESSLHG